MPTLSKPFSQQDLSDAVERWQGTEQDHSGPLIAFADMKRTRLRATASIGNPPSSK